MKRREFITLLGGHLKHWGVNLIFAGNIAFALIVLGLLAIDLVAAEYAATGGKMIASPIAISAGP
jgi:hypothetical protein